MKITDVITFLIAVLFLYTYIEHTKHDHDGVAPVVDVVPAKSKELLDFIEGCKRDGLIVTPIDENTVSCTRG